MQKKINKSFIYRLIIYFRERFPFFTYLIFVNILYLSLSFISQILSNQQPNISKQTFVGIIATFFLMLLIRTFDDLKDHDLDNEIFPERPVSRGAVLISDVKFLALFSFLILIAINVLFAQKTLFIFSGMMLYLLLTFKWFFTKEAHLKNPKIAMVTHQPIPFSILFYLVHLTLSSANSYTIFTKNHCILFLIYVLPITAWEVSRKIKSKEKENKYETFSKIFGINKAVMIPIVLYTISAVLSIYLANLLNFNSTYNVLTVIYLTILYFYFLRFLQFPIEKNNQLQKIAMLFTALFFSTLTLFLLMNYSIKIVL